MEFKDFLKLIKIKKTTVFAIVLLCMSIAVLFTIVQSFRYEAKSKLLIVTNHNMDTSTYDLSKLNGYLSNLFAEIIKSDDFYNEVVNSGYNINENYFLKKGEDKKIEIWKKSISAKTLMSDNGIIDIRVYHTNKGQARQISEAINYVLKIKNGNYHGLNNNVNIKIIDKPIISRWPVKPNILLNFLLTIIIGIFISFVYIYFFPERRYDLKVFPGKKKKDNPETNEYKRVEDSPMNYNKIEESTKKHITGNMENVISW